MNVIRVHNISKYASSGLHFYLSSKSGSYTNAFVGFLESPFLDWEFVLSNIGHAWFFAYCLTIEIVILIWLIAPFFFFFLNFLSRNYLNPLDHVWVQCYSGLAYLKLFPYWAPTWLRITSNSRPLFFTDPSQKMLDCQ